jgi:serine/threonine protein phosphatase 1
MRPHDPDRVYAIGDIHGYLDKLIVVHEAIEADLAANPAASHAVVHIGDYTDRGPDSRGVIDYLIAGADRPWINLYGNHDRMFLKYVADGSHDPRMRSQFFWLHPRLGGQETLLSYGVEVPVDLAKADGDLFVRAAQAAVPAEHLEFLLGLQTHWHWRDWFFSHAGVKPGVSLDDQTEDDLIWIRAEFHESRADHGATVIYGHTPVEHVEDHGNRIAIDTGAGYGGPLSCVVLEADGRARVLGGPVLR